MKAFAFCLGALFWLCVAPVAAADLGDTVPGHPGLTYFDLMRLVVTDLAPGGKDGAVGHQVMPFEHIDGKEAKGDPPETIALQYIETMAIPGDESRIVILADLGPSEGQVADAALLALFVLSPAPRLLDVVEVGTDRFTSFSDAKVGLLAPRTPLILITSTHSNSEQTYLSTKVMFVRRDRFQLIDAIFTFGERSCAYDRTQEPSFTMFAGPRPYSAVHVSVLERVTLTGEACDDQKAPRPSVATYQANYRWDARRQRFTTRSGELDRLAAEDAKRF
ncbi:hypothetical protein [Methylocapsa sp. S129]|uniref:hypothetical protein n=1 Tax=Methylocapsa sp. S129 TaxID=1641869 RepID=UPI00131C8004|nr:hypothetical protein [Methylocapsa sp. S129]